MFSPKRLVGTPLTGKGVTDRGWPSDLSVLRLSWGVVSVMWGDLLLLSHFTLFSSGLSLLPRLLFYSVLL